MNTDTALIHVRGLAKSYGDFAAVKGIDFDVHAGEVFGLLGPNGAGKTTTVEILEGLRPRTAGEVSVLGIDPGAQSRELKDRIGVCLQSTNLPDKIRVREAMDLFGEFYSHTTDASLLLTRLLISSASTRAASLNGLNRHSTAPRASRRGRMVRSSWPVRKS